MYHKTFHHVFVRRKRSFCLKLIRRLNRPKDTRKSSTCRLLGFCRRPISASKYPIIIKYFSRNWFNLSSRSGRC